jgi:hypothetical protein
MADVPQFDGEKTEKASFTTPPAQFDAAEYQASNTGYRPGDATAGVPSVTFTSSDAGYNPMTFDANFLAQGRAHYDNLQQFANGSLDPAHPVAVQAYNHLNAGETHADFLTKKMADLTQRIGKLSQA